MEWPRTGIGENTEAVRKVAMSGPIPPQGIKDAIEDNEEEEDTLDPPEGAAVDEPLRMPQQKKLRSLSVCDLCGSRIGRRFYSRNGGTTSTRSGKMTASICSEAIFWLHTWNRFAS